MTIITYLVAIVLLLTSAWIGPLSGEYAHAAYLAALAACNLIIASREQA